MSNYIYEGEELDLFNHAVHWKQYWGRTIASYVRGRVLDVGAGQGNNLPVLLNSACESWTALEPDQQLLNRTARLGAVAVDPRVQLVCGDSRDLLQKTLVPVYDTIVYIDVMEHIDEDVEEFRRSASLLAPGGHLVVLSPAFQALYSPFDAAIGHCRRYDRKSLGRLSAEGLECLEVRFLDSVGFLLSLSNKLVLKQSMPTLSQIKFWDDWVIPISRRMDVVLGRLFGRSIVGVWRKQVP